MKIHWRKQTGLFGKVRGKRIGCQEKVVAQVQQREVEVMHEENFPELPWNSKCTLKAADPTAMQA